MEHWIGYYAALYAAFKCIVILVQIGEERESKSIIAVAGAISICMPLPLILHAWGVL